MDEALRRQVIDCAREVHRNLGPGLFQDVYETCLAMELSKAGVIFERGRVLPLIYDGHQLEFTCQADFILGESLLLQVEAVDEIELIHEQRLRSCLWMGGFPSGLLLNFNVVKFTDGITEMSAPVLPHPTRDIFGDPQRGLPEVRIARRA